MDPLDLNTELTSLTQSKHGVSPPPNIGGDLEIFPKFQRGGGPEIFSNFFLGGDLNLRGPKF